MARIQPVDVSKLPPSVQIAFERYIEEYNVSITNTKTTLAHSLLAFEAYMQWHALYRQVQKILGKRLTNIYAYAISRATDCQLCSAFFRKVIIEAGEKPESLLLTPLQKDVFDFGSSIAKYHGNISDHLYNRVGEQYSAGDMVVLIAFAGQMIAATVFNNAAETDVDEHLSEYLPSFKCG